MSLLNNQEVIKNIETMRKKLRVATINEDGRINSITDDESAKLLWKEFPRCFVGEKRDFYDLGYEDEYRKKHYFNFKSSNFSKKASDNLNAKEAILLAFTDLTVSEISKIRTWNSLTNALIKNKKDIDRDYYYIVFDKSSDKYIFSSVKSLDNLTANGNNKPCQCKWSKHTPQVNRTFEDSYKYIFSILVESYRLAAAPYLHYENLTNERKK